MLNVNRRTFLAATSAAAVSPLWASHGWASQKAAQSLTAAPGWAALLGPDGPKTEVWTYGGSAPGPVLKVKQGERFRLSLDNRLAEGTTIHWHGIRLENAMDGVPYLTQSPVSPDRQFLYDFVARDAGTYWYHPHVNSAVQVARGLHGALIVEESEPPEVDRDVVWLLDDWRLTKDGEIAPFGGLHDAAHAGRLGNVATINGQDYPVLEGRRGERIRLRLINAANARVFGLRFGQHNPWRIAVDGHPVAPFQLGAAPVVVPPGGRVDLILDLNANADGPFDVTDVYYRRSAYKLATLTYSEAAPVRTESLPPPLQLPANPVAGLDLANAERREMVFQGGAMGGLASAEYKGKTLGLRELAGIGMVWAVNGRIIPAMEEDNVGEPMLRLVLGKTYVLRWRNRTAFDHPIHLHGHSFRVISRNGKAPAQQVVMDTVLIRPDEFVDVAFVADNPGDWALHCHILEHAASGMMGYVTVA